MFVKKVSPRNLYTWTWPQQWERFSSTGNSRPARGLGENCNWMFFRAEELYLDGLVLCYVVLLMWPRCNRTGQSLFPNIIETHSHQNSMQCPFWLTSQLDRGADSLLQWLVGYYPQWHFGVLKVHMYKPWLANHEINVLGGKAMEEEWSSNIENTNCSSHPSWCCFILCLMACCSIRLISNIYL